MPESSSSSLPLPSLWKERLESRKILHGPSDVGEHFNTPTGLDFCSDDYLGLRRDPRLKDAAIRATKEWNNGAGLREGVTPLHRELETTLAAWNGLESALLFSTVHQCITSLIPCLLEPGDGVFADEMNHASLMEGCRLAGAAGVHVGVFAHVDLLDLEAKLFAWKSKAPGSPRPMILTDSVFSLRGDTADLKGLVQLCLEYDALLLVNESHAVGLLGESGSGLAELHKLGGQIPLVIGTMSKSLGSFGAYVACSRPIRDFLTQFCLGYIHSTALPPGAVAATLEAVKAAQAEPSKRQKALDLAAMIRDGLGQAEQCSAIVPFPLVDDEKAQKVFVQLQEQGFDVGRTTSDSTPYRQASLRITTGAHLEQSQVIRLVRALQLCL